MMQSYKNDDGDLIVDTAELRGIALDYWALRVCAKTHEEAEGMLAGGVNPSSDFDVGGNMIWQNKIAISPLPPDGANWVAVWMRPKPESALILPKNGAQGPDRVVANAEHPLRAAMIALVFGIAGPRVAVPPSIQALAGKMVEANTTEAAANDTKLH